MLRLPATASPPYTPPVTRATKKIRIDENDPNNNFVAASNAANVANVTSSMSHSPSKSGNILVSPTNPGKVQCRRKAKETEKLNQQLAAALMKENKAEAKFEEAEMENNKADAKFEEAEMKNNEAQDEFEEEMMGGDNPEFTLCNPKYEVAADFFGNGDKFATGSTGTTESKKITELLPPGTITQYQVSHLTAVQCEKKNYNLGYGGYEGNFSGTIRGELGFDNGKCIAASKVNKDKMRMLVKEGKGPAAKFKKYHVEIPFQVFFEKINGVRLVKKDPTSPSGWALISLKEFISNPLKAEAFEVENQECRDSLAEALEFTKKPGYSAGMLLQNGLTDSSNCTGEHVMLFDVERFHGNTTYPKLNGRAKLQKIAGFRYKIRGMKKFASDKVVSQQGNNAEADSKPTAAATATVAV